MKVDDFIKSNELEFEKLTVQIIDDKAYIIIDDGTLIEGIYEELIKFID